MLLLELVGTAGIYLFVWFSPCKEAKICAAEPHESAWIEVLHGPQSKISCFGCFCLERRKCYFSILTATCQHGYRCVWSSNFNSAFCNTDAQLFGVKLKLPSHFTQPLTNNLLDITSLGCSLLSCFTNNSNMKACTSGCWNPESLCPLIKACSFIMSLLLKIMREKFHIEECLTNVLLFNIFYRLAK